ncbi:MAG: response regulator transcription factor [Candidatus Doudnabacteria bacterium]|nr:response regulator transcription factor [Candidatus Doudnabacteria bacterium]
MAKVLIVEDEPTISEVIQGYLKRAGIEGDVVADGGSALEQFESHQYDLVLLDLNLPGIDGVEVCKQIRAKSIVPIIMVTARVEEIDELIGLEIGADDYVKKPFSPQVLVARVQSLLRRVGTGKLQIADLVIDPEKMEITKSATPIVLTTTQFNIVYNLAQRPGKVFSRDELSDGSHANIDDTYILDRTIDAHIKSIRKALGDDPKNPKYIITVIGKGYKFNEHY